MARTQKALIRGLRWKVTHRDKRIMALEAEVARLRASSQRVRVLVTPPTSRRA
jgi:hypothetical protein